jgi:hypothetical protein
MKWCKKYSIVFIFVIFLIAGVCTAAFADVTLSNGNFNMGYTDIITSKDSNLLIDRFYNSKSPFNGVFGIGWGTYFETSVAKSASGELVLHKFGNGREERFYNINRPANYNSQLSLNSKNAAIFRFREDSIAMKPKHDAINRDSIINSILAHYRSDFDALDDDWGQYILKTGTGIIIPTGEVFENNINGVGTIIKTARGYRRIVNKEKVEFYNELGKLTQIQYTVGKEVSFIYINYNEQNLPEIISSSKGSSLYLFYNQYNKVERILSSENEFCTYHYSTNNYFPTLIYSKDTSDNVYIFEYDKRYNLIKILYSDHTQLLVEYNGPFENVSKLIDRNNVCKTFDYKYKDSKFKHLIVTVSEYDASMKKVNTTVTEFMDGKRKT